MIKKNDILTGTVQSFGSDGEGVLRMEDYVFFVPYALPGEKISFRVLKIQGKIGYGKVEEIFVSSPDRVSPVCPVFHTCGGCGLQHMNYALQTEYKREKVKNALLKIGGVEAEVSPVVPCASPYGYRNKLQLPVGVDGNGNTVLGFYAERSHRIVPIDRCYIHPEWSAKLIAVFKEYLACSEAKGYDERAKKGLIRHLVAREIDGKYLVTIVETEKNLPEKELLIEKLQTAFPGCSAFVNVNKSDSNVIFGERFYSLCGAEHIEGETDGIAYEAGAETFVQVNPEIREKLYERAMEACFAGGAEVVIDAYSGGGLMTAMAARRAKRAYGIELNAEASACAESLKKKNNLANMTNVCGDAAAELPRIMAEENGEKTVLILDPPRAGVARSVLYAILKSKIERFVMISCDPATLARDLGILTGTLVEKDGVLIKNTAGARDNRENNYFRIESVEPFDMFPQTKHVETLVVLSHKKPDSHLEVKIDFDNTALDKTAIAERAEKRKPQEKTTYKKIQEWIEENYGFKVYTAYVAEVKRELGLPMYDAPNAVEELKRPRSHPTEEMTIAIKAALKHFEII